MEYSIIKFSDIDLGNRVDAEYFQPTYLHIEKALETKQSIPLKKFCSITGSAFYPAATHLYEIGDVPFIRCVDCISFPTITKRQSESFEKIPGYFVDDYKNIKTLSKGDIVITKVGTPCFSSIVNDIDKVALSRTVLGIRNIQKINPYYLTVFLRSDYGFLQLFRERELTIQYQLTLERVGNILIYKPKHEHFENFIAKLFLEYENNIRKSIGFYNQANDILLSELDIENWQPKQALSFIKNYSDTQNFKRIDAEYFQPKYDEIINTITSFKGGWNLLGNLVKIRKCVEPGSSAYYDSGIPFVRVSDLSEFDITFGNTKYISEELYNLLRIHQPKKDEILLSKDATPGIAFHLRENPPKMIPSGGILILTIKDKNRINEKYLTLVLNSIIVQQQMLRDSGGSVIYHWRPDQIKNVIIPLIRKSKQDEIKSKITESFDNRKKSKQLLETAKRGIEIAVEKDENTAQNWIDEQLKINNLSLITNAST